MHSRIIGFLHYWMQILGLTLEIVIGVVRALFYQLAQNFSHLPKRQYTLGCLLEEKIVLSGALELVLGWVQLFSILVVVNRVVYLIMLLECNLDLD